MLNEREPNKGNSYVSESFMFEQRQESDPLLFPPHFLLSYSTLRKYDLTCRRSPASLMRTAHSGSLSLFASSNLDVQQPCGTDTIRMSYSGSSQASLLALSDPPLPFTSSLNFPSKSALSHPSHTSPSYTTHSPSSTMYSVSLPYLLAWPRSLSFHALFLSFHL